MSTPDPVTQPFSRELYDRLLPLQTAAGGDLSELSLWCQAKGAMIDELYSIIEDDPATGAPGYAVVMSADTCPAAYLGWLAQFRGVTLDPGLDDASQRLRIKTTDGFRRGSPGAIIGAAQTYLTGNRTVILRERWDPTADGGNGGIDPYHFQLITYADETPDPTLVASAVGPNSQKPGGLIMHLETITGQDYEHIKDTMATFGAIPATYATYEAIREGH